MGSKGSVALVLILLWRSRPSSSRNMDYNDAEWDQLFGHLEQATSHTSHMEDDPGGVLTKEYLGKNETPYGKIRPPELPKQPFTVNSETAESRPNVGAQSQGHMEGIAISQNKGISLGIYMGNSSYNNLSYVLGNKNPVI